jgi:predicted RNA-binding Zn ribbon-like protein
VQREALVRADVQPGERPPAPAPLELVQAFVNTVDREHGPDLLDDPAGLRDWMAHRGLGGRRARIGPGDLRAAREVREALRTLLGGGGDEDAARGVLQAAAERVRLRPRFDREPPALEAAAGGVHAALGAVLAAAFGELGSERWARLKACPGERCGWAFYDRSPARRARWCSMRVCGNRAKAASYYRRRRGRRLQ